MTYERQRPRQTRPVQAPIWRRAAVALAITASLGACSTGGASVTTQTNRIVEPTPIAAPAGQGTDGTELTLEVVDGGAATGLVLTDHRGMALYGLADETPEALLCEADCTQVWVPVRPREGTVNDALDPSLYRTITRPDGTMQAVYNNVALYQWTGDTKIGITNGAGVAGVWFAMTETGNFSAPG